MLEVSRRAGAAAAMLRPLEWLAFGGFSCSVICHMHQLLDRLRIQWLDARRPGCVPQQPVRSLRQIAAAPATYRKQALAYRRRNRLRRRHLGRPAARSAPSKPSSGCVPVPDQPPQFLAISSADRHPFDFSHRRRLAGLSQFVNRLSASDTSFERAAIKNWAEKWFRLTAAVGLVRPLSQDREGRGDDVDALVPGRSWSPI